MGDPPFFEPPVLDHGRQGSVTIQGTWRSQDIAVAVTYWDVMVAVDVQPHKVWQAQILGAWSSTKGDALGQCWPRVT